MISKADIDYYLITSLQAKLPRIRDGECCVFECRENEVPEDNAIVFAEHVDVINGEKTR